MDKKTLEKAREKFIKKLLSFKERRIKLMIDENEAYGEFYSTFDPGDDPPKFFDAVKVWCKEKTTFPDQDPATIQSLD